MNDKFLYDMLQTTAVSGHEEALQDKVIDYMRESSHQILKDGIHNVVCALNPESSARILITAHADEIGLVVTAVTEDGFLSVTKTGGIYCGTYPGHKVRVVTRQKTLYGSVLHHHELAGKKDLSPADLLIDIGASSKAEAEEWVTPGDFVVFDTDYRTLLGNRLSARALDDRIGIFCIMEALKKAGERGCEVGVFCASTVGEETSKNGAFWVSSSLKPAIAIVVDVTGTSDYEGIKSSEGGDIKLGKGPVLLHHPLSHKKINDHLIKAAEHSGISIQAEVGAGRTCTDADQIHFSNQGVPVAVVSVPLRYMHTPGEVCDRMDVEGCIDLLAEFLCQMKEEDELFHMNQGLMPV